MTILTIEEQIQFIKEQMRKADDADSHKFMQVLDTLARDKERLDEKTLGSFDHFISPEVVRLLQRDGFTRGDYHDPYSGTKEQVIWHKFVGTDQYRQYHTVCITKNEIGIEVEYDYGGGTTGGHWTYTEDDMASFMEVYQEVVEKVLKNQLTPPKA